MRLLTTQQDGLEQAKVTHLAAKTAQPSRPRRATCHTQRLQCNNNMGFQPSQTLKLLFNPFPQPRAWLPAHPRTLLLPKPNRQVPTSRTQKWHTSAAEATTESCRVLQRLPRLVWLGRPRVIWGGWPVWDVRQRSESLVWTEICPYEATSPSWGDEWE